MAWRLLEFQLDVVFVRCKSQVARWPDRQVDGSRRGCGPDDNRRVVPISQFNGQRPNE
ncbi:MAG: hypothetical protein ACK55I_19245 [bacterium]